jgi:membrane protein DedA with SNARE-associated domain
MHDMLYMLIGALVVYAVGRLLIDAFFRRKRRHQQNLIRDLIRGDDIS